LRAERILDRPMRGYELGRLSTRPELRAYPIVTTWNHEDEHALKRRHFASDFGSFVRRLESIHASRSRSRNRKAGGT
jgi:hypothetical protein